MPGEAIAIRATTRAVTKRTAAIPIRAQCVRFSCTSFSGCAALCSSNVRDDRGRGSGYKPGGVAMRADCGATTAASAAPPLAPIGSMASLRTNEGASPIGSDGFSGYGWSSVALSVNGREENGPTSGGSSFDQVWPSRTSREGLPLAVKYRSSCAPNGSACQPRSRVTGPPASY